MLKSTSFFHLNFEFDIIFFSIRICICGELILGPPTRHSLQNALSSTRLSCDCICFVWCFCAKNKQRVACHTFSNLIQHIRATAVGMVRGFVQCFVDTGRRLRFGLFDKVFHENSGSRVVRGGFHRRHSAVIGARNHSSARLLQGPVVATGLI